MKAKTNNTNRILSTIGLLVLAVTIGYGQGLLAESAIKLLKINQPVIEVNDSDFIFVNHTEEKDSFSFRNLFAETFQNRVERELKASEIEETYITRTIFASAVEIKYESDVATEQWMTTPLSNNLETNEVENWMTESFSESFESELTVENWMTESFSESFESELTVENWMTESFSESFESELTVENWMTESFTESVESDLTVENWMTESFTESVECELEVEEWMTVSLYESIEEEIEVDDWMITSLAIK